MGRHMIRLLKFAIRYRDGWHSYGHDRSTVTALNSLSSYGLLDVDTTTRQFRLHVEESV